MKYVIVYGGVISGLGKGTIASSIGYLLKSTGLHVTAIKIDPYLNVDAGMMSPYEHGEVYVLDDGGEVDLDLGNYERFLDINLTKNHNLTTGKLYLNVIQKERNGDYLGKTVQSLPHLTDYIQDYIERTANEPISGNHTADVCIIELGGTTGDQEQTIYLEALSRFSKKKGNDCCNIYISLVPSVHENEPKTKPTQLALREFSSYSIAPDILCLRVNKETNITENEKCKLKHFLKNELEYSKRIIVCPDINNVYQVPHHFVELIPVLLQHFGLRDAPMQQHDKIIWQPNIDTLCNVKIAIVGKYTGMRDTYLSLYRAIEHASFQFQYRLEIDWIDSEQSSDLLYRLERADGIIIPGGFGARGIDGMILAAKYARENKKPILGICLGMQVMAIEIARTEHPDANSTEFDPSTSYPIVTLQSPDGAMNLGSRAVTLVKDTLTSSLYSGVSIINERYRHRYQVNNKLIHPDIIITGTIDSEITIIETSKEIFSIGCQFHPEYRSRHNNPHPLFLGLLGAACNV